MPRQRGVLEELDEATRRALLSISTFIGWLVAYAIQDELLGYAAFGVLALAVALVELAAHHG